MVAELVTLEALQQQISRVLRMRFRLLAYKQLGAAMAHKKD